MTAREKLIEFLASNADMLTPNQAERVDALREKQAQSGALGVDVGSKSTGDQATEHCVLCSGMGRRYIVNPWSSNPLTGTELVTCCDCEGAGRRPVRSNSTGQPRAEE